MMLMLMGWVDHRIKLCQIARFSGVEDSGLSGMSVICWHKEEVGSGDSGYRVRSERGCQLFR